MVSTTEISCIHQQRTTARKAIVYFNCLKREGYNQKHIRKIFDFYSRFLLVLNILSRLEKRKACLIRNYLFLRIIFDVHYWIERNCVIWDI